MGAVLDATHAAGWFDCRMTPSHVAVRRGRRALGWWLAGTLIVGLAGCSASAGSSPEEAAQTFFRSLGAKDTKAACGVVAYAGKPLAGDDLTLCASGFDSVVAVAGADDLTALRGSAVSGAQVYGDKATVRADQLTGVPTAYRQDLGLVRVDGRWYLDIPQ